MGRFNIYLGWVGEKLEGKCNSWEKYKFRI